MPKHGSLSGLANAWFDVDHPAGVALFPRLLWR